MPTTADSTTTTHRVPKLDGLPGYVYHPSFADSHANSLYHPDQGLIDTSEAVRYMPDEVTRDRARRMHYAAHKIRNSKQTRERNRWQAAYLALRDQIILGNRKLIFRAVRRRGAYSNQTDDMIGECQIVLIQVVAAFNPWLDIRFSTYAYTCLVRALSRLAQRKSSDWLTRATSLHMIPEGSSGLSPDQNDRSSSSQIHLDEFLRDDHPLLSPREKTIILRRFYPADSTAHPTLERVGQDMGLSKERVRQVQASALDKLRKALDPAPTQA